MSVSLDLKKNQITFSDGFTARWIFGDKGGMPYADVAEMLGIKLTTISAHIRRHNLAVSTISRKQTLTLREQGLLTKQQNHVNLVPRETIDKLVKHVNTREAWERYEELLTLARDAGENLKARVDVKGQAGAEDFMAQLKVALVEFKADLRKEIVEDIQREQAPLQIVESQWIDDKHCLQALTKTYRKVRPQLETKKQHFCDNVMRYIRRYNRVSQRQLDVVQKIIKEA